VPEKDITLRGSGELVHLIKEKKMSIEDVSAFCKLVWSIDSSTCLSEAKDIPMEILEKLRSLDLLRLHSEGVVILNPHVACVGDEKKRGEFRLKFRSLQ